MAAQYTIGIDLGGTNIKAGVLDGKGALTHRTSIATEAEQGFEHVFARLVRLVDQIIRDASLTRDDIGGIGFGTPGPMSHEEGIIYASPNLAGWVNIPMRKRFSEASGFPVTLENDANAAAYGEFVAGAGRDLSHVVMLTLGTGVGGGVISNGQLNRGGFDNAGEIGHNHRVAIRPALSLWPEGVSGTLQFRQRGCRAFCRSTARWRAIAAENTRGRGRGAYLGGHRQGCRRW